MATEVDARTSTELEKTEVGPLPSFSLLKIEDNPEGWGPYTLPEQFKDVPYQPFSKDGRLGKIADWIGSAYPDNRGKSKYGSSQFNSGTQYAYIHEEDESSFQLVNTIRENKTPFQRSRARFNVQQMQRNRRERERRQQQASATQQPVLGMTKKQKNLDRDRQRLIRRWAKQFGRQSADFNRRPARINRDASVQIADTWAVKEELDFLRLTKLALPGIKEPEDLEKCGEMEYYDKAYDRVTTRHERPLNRVNRIIHTVTTSQDPVIQRLAKKQIGNVYCTDSIIAILMCCPRSIYSWDILVQKVGDRLFFDKRTTSDSEILDPITVSETATDPPTEEPGHINSPKNLSDEALFINTNFSQQVLKMNDEKHRFPNPNPFIDEDDDEAPDLELASVGYRYRKFDLGNGIQLVARCEHDAVLIGTNQDVQYVNVKALNEWDSRFCGAVDWRSKLDSQRGAVLAAELKNNACKLAKWTVCALLAGSDLIKFGYVSRVNPLNSKVHVILGTQQFRPIDFANQINLNMDNAWGILRCIIDLFMKMADGKYLIMKDPNKPLMRIYELPADAFDDNDDDDDDDADDFRAPSTATAPAGGVGASRVAGGETDKH